MVNHGCCRTAARVLDEVTPNRCVHWPSRLPLQGIHCANMVRYPAEHGKLFLKHRSEYHALTASQAELEGEQS